MCVRSELNTGYNYYYYRMAKTAVKQLLEIPSSDTDQAAHEDAVVLSCPVCKKSFRNNNYLRLHMKIHTGQFMCHIWLSTSFYAPGLKGPPGASSVWIVRPSVRLSVRLSVCLSVRPSVCPSVIPSRLHSKCNISSLGGHTVTKLGLKVHL